MVPMYAIASLISLFSVEAAFFIDAIRDITRWVCCYNSDMFSKWAPQAFVIYCFFALLLSYLGGERSLLILLHGRSPKEPVFPVNLVKREIDVSDPYTFLFLKRGIIRESLVSSPPLAHQPNAVAHRVCSNEACLGHRYDDFEGNREIQRRGFSC